MSAGFEYRLRYTNLPSGEGGPDALWQDVGNYRIQNVQRHCVLEFRPKPRRSRSLVAAAFRRARKGQQRGEGWS